jgi:hypothetical protein
MSFSPAYVPEGTLSYHGLPVPERVTGMECLAFETQHAEQHAQSHAVEDDERKGHIPAQHQDPTARSPGHLSSQSPFSLNSGYLQMYQTNRPLKLLYIDGMSGGMRFWTVGYTRYHPAVPSPPRLLFMDPEVILRIKSDLGHVLEVSLPHPSTNWQVLLI